MPWSGGGNEHGCSRHVNYSGAGAGRSRSSDCSKVVGRGVTLRAVCVGTIGLPDLASKNTGYLVNTEFQINNEKNLV